jgi:hypothetical protein
MHGLMQLSRTVSLLNYKHFGQLFLKFNINRFVASCFFLYRDCITLLPPTLGIAKIIIYTLSTITILIHIE